MKGIPQKAHPRLLRITFRVPRLESVKLFFLRSIEWPFLPFIYNSVISLELIRRHSIATIFPLDPRGFVTPFQPSGHGRWTLPLNPSHC
eukprot:4884670-Karenia_brevis.AAC.1